MTARATRYRMLPLIGILALLPACGEFIRQDSSPITLIISTLEGAPGYDQNNFTSNLISDVETDGVRWNDLGRVTLRMILKDPGNLGLSSSPTVTNQVTIDTYRVSYRRADGGPVPEAFEGALTFTIPAEGQATAAFQLVRTAAKFRLPLSDLVGGTEFINVIADVTFSGRDQAGKRASVTGSIQIEFGDFVDP